MQNSDDYQDNLGTGILIQGGFATGKTSLALQFPRPYVYDADNNLAGAIRRAKAKGIKFQYDIGTIDDKGNPVEDVDSENCRWTRMTACITAAFKSPNIDTVILDTASSVSEFLMAYLLLKNGKSEMSIPLWGQYLNAWKKFITTCRSQNKLFIINVHEKLEKNDEDQGMQYEVTLPGQIQQKIGSFMSDVWRMEIMNKKDAEGKDQTIYAVRTKPTPKVKLRCSFPDMPGLWDSSSVKTLYKGLALPLPPWYKE